MNLYAAFFKRLFDFILALLIIVILSPLIFAIFIILAVVYKASPLFYQDRPGKNEKCIRIIKFKSMTDQRDTSGNLLPDVERITKAGSFCRKYSLDELPQLLNVLKGDMSLVGPRPLLYKYLELYSNDQRRRHEVRPGITGWAQVNGRNTISWAEKFKLDVYYVDNLSLEMDIKILFLTFLKVIKKEGVNQSTERPMMPFNGHN
jgi:lipopolysaccharide/colanic/teichoic acid biosynthesis glycosyltransferase